MRRVDGLNDFNEMTHQTCKMISEFRANLEHFFAIIMASFLGA